MWSVAGFEVTEKCIFGSWSKGELTVHLYSSVILNSPKDLFSCDCVIFEKWMYPWIEHVEPTITAPSKGFGIAHIVEYIPSIPK